MKKSELIKIIKEEVQNIIKEEEDMNPANVMIAWMSPDPARNPELLQQRVAGTGLNSLVKLNNWMGSPEGQKFLVQDDARTRAIKNAIKHGIESKQAKGEQ
tara:strand:- start:120 stop:422 length:303 start_codon:yes stop_codon:yes gene_type:complete